MTARACIPSMPVGETLGVLRRLFADLHAADVMYCHWKSNEHLDASMIGATDLDLLVDRAAASDFERILSASGFKLFPAVAARRYPGITDWLGLDPDRGVLVHLHVHYQLTVGESHLKGYRLPWEQATLATRVLDAGSGVFIAEPHIEAVLLLVRAALKVRTRDLLTRRGRRGGVTGGALRELKWLAVRIDAQRLLAVASSLVGDAAAQMLGAMVAARSASHGELRTLRAICQPSLDVYRLYDPIDARRRRWIREFGARIARTRRSAPGVRPSRRLGLRGGTMIALVGADGAGKSSLSVELARWLGAKLDVTVVYGGSGVGTASLARRVLRLIVRPFRRPGGSTPERAEGAQVGSLRESADPVETSSRVGSVAALVRGWLIDRERRSRLRDAWRARSGGVIVLSDRFPQREFPGVNDGPRLGMWRGAPWPFGAAAAREEDTFRFADTVGPDLVVKLVVPFDVATRRKPDTPPSQLRKKIEIVSRLRYGARTKVVIVDASAPWDDVLLQVKRCVWEAL